MTKHPNSPARIGLPWNEWPDFDQAAWASIIRRGDVFDEAGASAHWSEATRAKRAWSYGCWLGFLNSRNWLNDAIDPADRVRPDTVLAFVGDASARCTPMTVAVRVKEIYWVIRAMRPETDWHWLQIIAHRLRQRLPVSELRPTPPVSAADVYNAGRATMGAAEAATEQTDKQRAIRFRDGLILALLIARPLRLRTFANIEIERNLIRTADGYLLVFTAEDIKTKRPVEYAAPVELVSSIDRYVEHYRPILLGDRTSSRLWITQFGEPYATEGFGTLLTRLTPKVFGVSFRAHAFRHIAATSIATEDPAHVHIITSVLGHTSLNMADKHYNRARQADAIALYQDVIADLRARSRD